MAGADVVKAVPDRAQQPVRERALRDGKLLYIAVPMLADDLPFYLLDPASLAAPLAEAASREGAARTARKIGVDEMRPVDLVICGSVAVNRNGARLGKGAGYSDIEVALLQEAGLIGPQTVIATTVHPLQVIDEALPETEHDFSVDLVVTPDEVIECGPPLRPGGLYWEHLTEDKIASIPLLTARAAASARERRMASRLGDSPSGSQCSVSSPRSRWSSCLGQTAVKSQPRASQ